MKNGRILFFSRDPGGANLMISVYSIFPETEKLYFAKDYSVDYVKQQKIDHIEVVNDEVSDLFSQYQINSSDRVLTGTSNSDDDFENRIWSECTKNKIPFYIFVDQPFRMKERFLSKDGKFYRADPQAVFVPTDEAAPKVNEFFPKAKIVSIGYPQIISKINEFKKAELGKKISDFLDLDEGKKTLLFVSEPESKNIESIYDERELFDQVKELVPTAQYNLVLKLHPKDEREWNFKDTIRTELGPFECIDSSDLILGVKSIMLLEGAIFGKSVLSLDYLNGEDERVFTSIFSEHQKINSLENLNDFFSKPDISQGQNLEKIENYSREWKKEISQLILMSN